MAEIESIARDSTFLVEFLRGFKTDVEAIFGRLDIFVASGQWGAVHDLMHSLKGAAVGVGAQQLAARCDEFDAAVSADQTGQLAKRKTELRQCFDATLVQPLRVARHRNRGEQFLDLRFLNRHVRQPILRLN